jgi:1-acyl-sn-glycerol-3-phosphate acyltransferase
MTDTTHTAGDEQLVLRDIRALLDQLQLDRDHTLSMHSSLTDELGVDSLALVELCDQLERTFDVFLPDEVFLTAVTPQQWLEAINMARGGEAAQRDDPNSSRGTSEQSPPSLRTRAEAISKRLINMVHADRMGQSASAGSIVYALYAWALLVPFALSIWLLAVLPMTLSRRRNAGRAIARLTCRALGLSVTVEGKLPDTNHPSVIAANHSSFIDGLMLYVFVDQPLTFVSSTDMEHQFLWGPIMRGFGCVFVERGRAERSAASVEVLMRAIRSGHHVLIFPEGSISARPGLRVFHLGAFETATSSNCPVVPVGIRGSSDVLRPGSFRPHPGAVHIAIGEPILPAGNEFSDRVAMRDEVRDAIARLCAEES